MTYKIQIDDKVIKDLKNIDKKWQVEILKKIKSTLSHKPYSGKKLAGILSKYHRLRVGKYRIIYQIIENKVQVEVIKISHRREVYKNYG